MTARSELTVRVAALAATLNVPVAYENNTFVKPLGNTPFLEMFVVPAVTVDVSVDGTRQRELGYMQINVWCPTGSGTKQGEDIAQALKAAFPIIPIIGSTAISSTPTIRQAIFDSSSGYRIIPVMFNYRLEIQA